MKNITSIKVILETIEANNMVAQNAMYTVIQAIRSGNFGPDKSLTPEIALEMLENGLEAARRISF